MTSGPLRIALGPEPILSRCVEICSGVGISSLIPFQWTIESAGNELYYFKNGKGNYLSFEGQTTGANVSQGRLVSAAIKDTWRIVEDPARPLQPR